MSVLEVSGYDTVYTTCFKCFMIRGFIILVLILYSDKMDIQYLLFVIFVFLNQGIIGQSDQSDQCTITIWHQNRDVTELNINIRDGEEVELLCDARCVGQGVTPILKWGKDAPNRVYFQDIPGRVYSSNSMDGSLQTLSIKGFSQRDVGSYMCRGWIGKYVTAHVNIRLEATDSDIGKLFFRRRIP